MGMAGDSWISYFTAGRKLYMGIKMMKAADGWGSLNGTADSSELVPMIVAYPLGFGWISFLPIRHFPYLCCQITRHNIRIDGVA